MEINQSYVALLILTYLKEKHDINYISTEMFNTLLDTIQDQLFERDEIQITFTDITEFDKSALKNVCEFHDDAIVLVNLKKAQEMLILWKLKFHKSMSDILIFDSLFYHKIITSTWLNEMIQKQKQEEQDNLQMILTDSLYCYNKIIVSYQILSSLEYHNCATSKDYQKEKESLIKNKEKAKYLLNRLAQYKIFNINFNQVKQNLDPLNFIHRPNSNYQKLAIDFNHLKLNQRKEKRQIALQQNLNFREQVIYPNEIGTEEFNINYYSCLTQLIESNLLTFPRNDPSYKQDLINLKYSTIALNPQLEKRFLENDYDLFKNYAVQKLFEQVPDQMKYGRYIQSTESMLNHILNLPNDWVDDYYIMLIDTLAITQSTINLNSKENYYTHFMQLFENHKNHNNPNFSIAQQLFKSLIHDKEDKNKFLQKK